MAATRRSRLITARNRVTRAMGQADVHPRDLAALSRELRALELELEEIDSATPEADELDAIMALGKESHGQPSTDSPGQATVGLD